MAISAKIIMIQKLFLYKNKQCIVVVLVPIFVFLLGHLHFFLHFFFAFMENLFKKHPLPSLEQADPVDAGVLGHAIVDEEVGSIEIVKNERAQSGQSAKRVLTRSSVKSEDVHAERPRRWRGRRRRRRG